MADIVNLNRWRKAKTRADDERTAQVNRAAFGRTKAQKQAERTRREQIDKVLDGARLEQNAGARLEQDAGARLDAEDGNCPGKASGEDASGRGD